MTLRRWLLVMLLMSVCAAFVANLNPLRRMLFLYPVIFLPAVAAGQDVALAHWRKQTIGVDEPVFPSKNYFKIPITIYDCFFEGLGIIAAVFLVLAAGIGMAIAFAHLWCDWGSVRKVEP